MVKKYVVSPHGGRGAHPDIGSALRAAAGRGRAARVEIAPGHYQEPLPLALRGEIELVALGEPGSVVVSRPRGTVLEAFGPAVVRGLVLVGRDADAGVVDCRTGSLTLDRTEIRAHNGVCAHARPGTSMLLTDSQFLFGRAVFAGSTGHVERCRFADAADNAIAVIEGARVTVRGTRIDGSRIHGVRVSDAWARLTGCEVTGTEKAAVIADTRAELIVEDCTVDAVQMAALAFIEQSRGTVVDTRVTDAENGILVASGADPLVRGCVFADCRDTGIHVQESGRGTFEHCEIHGAGNVGVLSTRGGAPRVSDCRISRGNVGIAVTDKARGTFTRIGVEDHTNLALRVREESKAVFEHLRVERCPFGLETRDNGGTTAELTDTTFSDFDMLAVAVLGQSRVTLRNVSAHRGLLGFGVGEEAQLHLHDCEATAVSSGGAIAYGTSRLVARNLAVTGSASFGIAGKDSALLDVADSRFDDCGSFGASFDDAAGGRLVNCSVTGTKGKAVRDNGSVELVALRTSLPIMDKSTPPATPPPSIVQIFNGPVFHGDVHGIQVAWGNHSVVQQQTHHSDQSDQDGVDR